METVKSANRLKSFENHGFHALIKNEHFKRVLEIAAVQGDPVMACGIYDLHIAARESGQAVSVKVLTIAPCPCGYYGDYDKPCECSVDEIMVLHKKIKRIAPHYMYFVAITRPDIMYLSEPYTSGERVEHVRERIKRAKECVNKVESIDDDAKNLLREAIKVFGMEVSDRDMCFHRARSIAALGGHDTIGCEDIAEAIQYKFSLR